MRVLAWMPKWLGDAVHATPALAALRTIPGLERLDVAAPEGHEAYYRALGWSQGFVPTSPGMGLAGRIRSRDYVRGVLMVRSFRAAWVLRRAGIPERLGVPDQGRGFLLTRKVAYPPGRSSPMREEFLSLARAAGAAGWVENPFKALRQGAARKPEGLPPTAVIHPGAAYGRAKVWPLDRYQALAAALASRGLKVLAVGGRNEKEACESVARSGAGQNAAGTTDLGGLMDLLGLADVFIGGDSGPLHLASALGRPVVGIYGSTSPSWTPPTGPRAALLWGRTTCGPCFRRDCAVGFRCLDLVTVNAVLREVLRFLGDRRPGAGS